MSIFVAPAFRVRRRRAGTLFLLGVLGILLPVLEVQASAQKKSAKPEAIAPSPYATRYRVIVRVVRPQWRTSPTQQQVRASTDYSVITSRHAPVRGAGSDAQFLNDLHRANPQFRFSPVRAKTSFLLDTDTLWIAPPDFCMQKFHFAIVTQNPELLRTQLKSGNEGTSYKGSVSELPELRKQKRMLVSYFIETFYSDREGKNQPDVASDICARPRIGDTISLNHELPVAELLNSKSSETLRIPTYDAVFVTISAEPSKPTDKIVKSKMP